MGEVCPVEKICGMATKFILPFIEKMQLFQLKILICLIKIRKNIYSVDFTYNYLEFGA
jgi:hypothetical protein